MQIAVIKAFFCGKVDFLSIYVANELFYARVDPNEMRLNRLAALMCVFDAVVGDI